jgi:PAS domain S-box-containing protein
MITNIYNANIAIVGGGNLCKNFLEIISDEVFAKDRPKIIGVADLDKKAPGFLYAKNMGFLTTSDYRFFYQFDELDIILEITKNNTIPSDIKKTMPSHVKLIDHFEANSLWHNLMIEKEKRSAVKEIKKCEHRQEEIEDIFEKTFKKVKKIVNEETEYSQRIKNELTNQQIAIYQIIKNSTIPTFVIDKNHIVIYWNKALEKLTGLLADKIVGTDNHWMAFRDEKRPTMADVILDQLEKGELDKYYGKKWRKSELIDDAYEAEEFFPNLSNKGKWCWFTAAPIKNINGKIIGAIETLWDTTESKEAEYEKNKYIKELAESERTISQIIQGSANPIFVIDKNHTVIHWNKAMEKLSNIPAGDILGTANHWMAVRDKKRPIMADIVLEQCDTGIIDKYYGKNWQKSELIDDAYEAEEFFPDLGEEGRWCRFTAAPIKTPDGKIIGAIETLWDITERKNAEEEKKRLAVIGQTVAGMAHGIKNILHGFKGGGYLVDLGFDKGDKKKIQDGWRIIKRNIERTSELALDVLSYSKKREPDYQKCFPNDIVDEVCELLQERALENKVRIIKDLSKSIKEIRLDKEILHRCLLNLVLNAIDVCIFDWNTDKKHTVCVKSKLEDNDIIRFDVEDNGSGISDEVKGKMFSSFFSTKGSKGTGLGLLVTKKLVEEHSGTIDVTSSLGKGTTFTIKLLYK